MKLFSDMSVLSAEECAARQSVMLNQYVGTVEIEVGTHCMYVCMACAVLSCPFLFPMIIPCSYSTLWRTGKLHGGHDRAEHHPSGEGSRGGWVRVPHVCMYVCMMAECVLSR